MDDFLLHSLGKALRDLEVYGDRLDDLLFPRSCPPEVGVVAGLAGSRPPLSIPIVDLKAETESVLCLWSGLLAREIGRELPTSRRISLRADYLSMWLLQLEQMPWAGRCAEQVIAQAQLVCAVVDDRPQPTAPSVVKQGTVREVVECANALGRRCSLKTVYRWIKSEHLPCEERGDGVLVIKLDDLLKCCNAVRKIDGDTAHLLS